MLGHSSGLSHLPRECESQVQRLLPVAGANHDDVPADAARARLERIGPRRQDDTWQGDRLAERQVINMARDKGMSRCHH